MVNPASRVAVRSRFLSIELAFSRIPQHILAKPRLDSITTVREMSPRSSLPHPLPPPQKKKTAVCSFWGPRERRKSSLHNGRPCYRGKNKYYSFSLQRSSWLVNWPLQTESNLTLPNSAFSSSWLQRQLAVRPPIIIGMVRHVPLAPSVGQGTEWKQNVAKSKTQSVKSVCLDTIGRITRAWNRVWSKLNCTQ